MCKEGQNQARLLASMVNHGATEVKISELFRESQLIWQIRPEHAVSETCIRLEEFMASAARNSQRSLSVMERMHGLGGFQDHDLLTALKKYVEDTCEAIKVVDNTLKNNGASLESLLFEIPNETSDDEVSWRNLIGRRDVIAHRLLTVDDDRVYREAIRDFGSLYQLLSKVYFAPMKIDRASGEGLTPLLRAEVLRSLAPSGYGQVPHIGQSLVFVCEDKIKGFQSFRFGRTEDNKLLIGASHAPRRLRLSVYELNQTESSTQQ